MRQKSILAILLSWAIQTILDPFEDGQIISQLDNGLAVNLFQSASHQLSQQHVPTPRSNFTITFSYRSGQSIKVILSSPRTSPLKKKDKTDYYKRSAKGPLPHANNRSRQNYCAGRVGEASRGIRHTITIGAQIYALCVYRYLRPSIELLANPA